MMRARATIVALLTCATAGGCAVGPNYVRPSAPVSATFKEVAGWSPAAPADTLDRGDWWTLFDDPVLNGLEARVKISNQNVAAAEAAYRQARALVGEQRAALFPTLDLTASGTRSGGGSGRTVTTGTGTGQTVSASNGDSYRAALGATWEIDVWGRIRRAVEGAKASAQASEADLAAATLSAQGELAADYFGLREADVELALDQATVAGYRRTLQIAQNQFNAGVAPRSDVLQAQTQLDNAQADLAATQQQRATYQHAIAVLVGVAPADLDIPAVADWAPKVPALPPVVPSTLLQRRPDIAAAERRVAAANAQIGVERAAYFPTLSLSGSYGGSGSDLGSLFSTSASVWSFGLATAETLFDGGARKSRVAAARAAHDQTVAQYRQVVLTALQGVEDQLAASSGLSAQYDLRRSASASADSAETMVANRYQAGQVSYIDVVTAQAAAYSARRALAVTTAQRQNAAVALIQALGGGWRATELR